MKSTWLLLLAVCLCGMVHGKDFNNLEPLYIGGGISSNRLDSFDNATGYQIFAGYNLPYMLGPVTTSVEAGYMDTGDFDLELNVPGASVSPPSVEAKGVWASVNIAYPVNREFGVLGRAGYDFGDDDGALLGVGVEFSPMSQLGVRGEYIFRQETESLQINLVYSPHW